jgi:hypothetical protein
LRGSGFFRIQIGVPSDGSGYPCWSTARIAIEEGAAMSTVLRKPPAQRRWLPQEARAEVRRPGAGEQAGWLLGGAAFAFLIPFVFADLIELQRDLFYGLYALSVGLFVFAWGSHTGLRVRDLLARNWRWGLVVGAAGAGVMVVMVVRTEDASARPDGVEFAAAIVWRGVLYGVTDGVLLSVFPILAVFAAFAGTRLRAHLLGKVVIGLVALVASMGVTAAYHLAYADFRSDKVRKPIAGDVIWSAPTLLTLSPLGAPIAHAGLHVGAVVHSYDTDTFLPPHVDTKEAQP